MTGTTGRPRPGTVPRAAAVLGAAAAAGAGGLALAGHGGHQVAAAATRVGPGAASDAVVALAGVCAGLVVAWLALGAVLTTLELLLIARAEPAGHVPPPALPGPGLAPVALRRLVAGALGVGLAVGVGGPASATSPDPAPTSPVAVALPVDPGWDATATPSPASPAPSETAQPTETAAPTRTTEATPMTPIEQQPDRPAPSPYAPAPSPVATDPGWTPSSPPPPVARVAADLGPLAAPPRPRTVAEDAVVVRRGDTLWDIAARSLPASAGDAQVAAEWPRWFEANRSVIGADPHHIEPGQRLVPPGASS